MSETTIRELVTLPEMLAQHALIQQLNPTMSLARYEELLLQMLPNGYRMAAVFTGDACVGLSGFWIGTKLYSGKYLEIDNFVVDSNYRSQRLGKQLSDWLHTIAEQEGCETIMLDAYATNAAAHKFYFREGFHIKGYHFYKTL
ncbi:GNAT family N-acetyltransferase [Pontibacter fetidus]|uniref:GNAT family N-acetyltransferase n=1 Tax=Pontibacter fetidus TaxID=2700082 RepID=A0A6B2H3R3_9BACT|nr:GNAT family N-acetyltransferase [Pontibacter fetidus]NDK54937.1 GNAT family N-acetyltransferase [Pontibacter fetidus]